MPERHELRAFHVMERGDFAAAEANLALAIKLAAIPTHRRNNAVSSPPASSAGPMPNAISCPLIEHEARNPEAWFMHAQSHLSLDHGDSARSDFEHARTLTPADWTTRPDVARFLPRLNDSSGRRRAAREIPSPTSRRPA